MSVAFSIPAAGVAVTIAAVGIAGIVVAGSALALGAVVLSGAAMGAGEIAAGMALERQRQHLLEVAGRDPLRLRVDRLSLREEYSGALQRVLERAPWQKLEGGELVLADGSARPVACAVRSSGGFLFSVAPADDGGLELFSFGDVGRKAAWSTYLRAIAEVARQRLEGDGWIPVETTGSRQICRLVRTNERTLRHDELLATYDAATGQILFRSRGWQGPNRRPLHGAECVNLDALKAAFTQVQAAATLPIEDSGGAAAAEPTQAPGSAMRRALAHD